MNGITTYNYYSMSGQVQRHQANKYDTHKKSELKNIYNSIVKMSRNSPVYIFDHSKAAREFAISIKEEARELKNTLSALDSEGDSGSLFGQKIAVSSNPDTVSARYIGSPSSDDKKDAFEITVEQLATPQVNTGNYLRPNRLKLMPGTYSFDIQTGGLSYGFQFKVSHEDTNQSIQERLAALITNSKIGLKAEVVADEDGFTALSIASDATGSENGKLQFNVSEASDAPEGGAVEYLGINHVSERPQNASFLLNGETHTAFSNTFTVNQNFEIALHNISEDGQPAVIGFKPDIDAVNDNIKELTRKYNSMIRLSGSYASDRLKSNLLHRNISSVAKQYTNYLEAIGLQLDQEGSLQVDDQLLNQSLTEDMGDTVNSLLKFKDALSVKTDEIMLNPMDYVNRKIVAYPNPGKTFSNPYITSIYSGMLFNSYC